MPGVSVRDTVPTHSPADLERRRFLQAAAAAVALSGPVTGRVDASSETDGFGEGGFGAGGFGGGNPFSVPIGHAAKKPTDLDGDGRYEDVDGDGRLSVADVQTLLAFLSSPVVQAEADLLDFDGDGGAVDVDDAQALFEAFVDGIERP